MYPAIHYECLCWTFMKDEYNEIYETDTTNDENNPFTVNEELKIPKEEQNLSDDTEQLLHNAKEQIEND